MSGAWFRIDAPPAWVLVLVAWFALVLIAVPVIQRRIVRKRIRAIGGKVVSIHWEPFLSLVHEKNTRRWRVTYECTCGQTVVGVMQTSIFTGTKWHEPPMPPAGAGPPHGDHDPPRTLR